MLTAGTFLMYKETSEATEYTKLADITEYPDLDSVPESIDNTTLTHSRHSYEQGLPDNGGSWEFPAYYNATDVAKVDALAGKVLPLAIWFGGEDNGDGTINPTGSIEKREFNGYVTCIRTGAGVDEVRPVTYVVTPTMDDVTV